MRKTPVFNGVQGLCHLSRRAPEVGRLLLLGNCQYLRHMNKWPLLLLLATGCKSKGSDPAPAVPALTYLLDGVATSYSNAPYVLLHKGAAANPPYQAKDDALFVIAESGTGQHGTGDYAVQVTFTKPFGSPDATYKIYNVIYSYPVIQGNITSHTAVYYSINPTGSVQQTPSGAWSGTFAADRLSGNPSTSAGTSRITQGVFSEAKP